MDNDALIDFLRNHKEEFREKYKIKTLGLFGSFANNNENAESDIDLLVDFEENTPDIFEKKQDIKSVLGKEFNRDVDVCTIKYIKPYLKEHILKQALYV